MCLFTSRRGHRSSLSRARRARVPMCQNHSSHRFGLLPKRPSLPTDRTLFRGHTSFFSMLFSNTWPSVLTARESCNQQQKHVWTRGTTWQLKHMRGKRTHESHGALDPCPYLKTFFFPLHPMWGSNSRPRVQESPTPPTEPSVCPITLVLTNPMKPHELFFKASIYLGLTVP